MCSFERREEGRKVTLSTRVSGDLVDPPQYIGLGTRGVGPLRPRVDPPLPPLSWDVIYFW